MREHYLFAVKNAMLWHFGTKEIKDTLEDVNAYFDAAEQDGVSEDDAREQYGTPLEAVKALQEEYVPKKRGLRVRKALLAMFVLVTVCCFFVLYRRSELPFLLLQETDCVLVCSLSGAVWLLTGNDCMAGILPNAAQRKKYYMHMQLFILGSFLILQGMVLFGLPYLLEEVISEENVIYSGPIAAGVAQAVILFFVLLALYLFQKMLLGNLWMYLILLQILGLVCSLCLFIESLYRLDDFYRGVWFMPYFTAVLLCIPVGLWIGKKEGTR